MSQEGTQQLPVLLADTSGALDIGALDPAPAFKVAEQIVQLVAKRCQGPKFIAPISGKNYPKVEWWTTVGASLGLFPREESSTRLDREGETAYEAAVGVYRGEHLVARASAICSSREKRWAHADEYAVKSMATTRATGKAYRLGLSFLAVMAGLEPTSAEEIPPGGFSDDFDREPPALPQEVETHAPQSDLPPVKAELYEELLDWPADKRDDVIRRCSTITDDDGKPKLKDNGKPICVESMERMLSHKISDKWAGATLKRVREMKARLKGGPHADAS